MPARKIASVTHAQEVARRRLPDSAYRYFIGGRGSGAAARANEAAFERFTFYPRAAVVHEKRVLETTILGAPSSMPLVMAPAGLIRLAWPHAELAAARVAKAAGIPIGVSTFSGESIEDIARIGAETWFQMYLTGGRRGGEFMIDRAARAGCRALFVTVDLPVKVPTESPARPFPTGFDLRTAFAYMPELIRRPAWAWRFATGGFDLALPNMPPALDGRRMGFAEAMSVSDATPARWSDFAWIREQWKGKLIIKGIMTADDARRAVDVGADGISVSNHGGNALDGLPAAIEVLPEIADAVGGQVELLVDGGVRRGSDVARAVALGARAAMMGRAYIWGLAAAGEDGARQIVELMRVSLDATLGMLGCGDVADLDRSWLRMPSLPPQPGRRPEF